MPYLYSLTSKFLKFKNAFHLNRRFLSDVLSSFICLLGLITGLNVQATNALLEKIWSPQFKTFTVDDGLSQSLTSTLLQDSDELIWLLTPTGVDRYNGYEFESMSFQSDLTENSMPQIRALFLNHQKKVMAVSQTGNFFIFNKELNHFVLLHAPLVALNVTHAQVLANGKVILFTSTGLHFFVLQSSMAHEIPLDIPELSSITNTHDVHLDVHNVLWIATQDGHLYSLDFNNRKLIKHIFERQKQGFHNDNLLISSLNNEEVVVAFNSGELFRLTHQKITAIPINKLSGIENQPKDITDILQAENGYIWVATRGSGLYRLSLEYLTARQYKYQNNLSGSISSNNLYSLFMTKQGFLWVGSPNGLNYAQVVNNRFYQIGGNKAYSIKLASPFVSSIFLDPFNQLWVGSHDAGFSILKLNPAQPGNSSKNKLILSEQNSHTLFPEPIFIKEIVSGPNNSIWVASKNQLTWLSAISAQFIPITGKWENVDKQNIESIAISDNAKLLINAKGHLTFENQQGHFFHHKLPTATENKTDLYTIIGPINDKYWIASGDQGNVYEFDSRNQVITDLNIVTKKGNKTSAVTSLWMSNTNELWMANYGDGVIRKNMKTGRLSWLDIDSGLPNNYIYGLLADSKGYLWITSNKGLSRFNLKSEELHNFTVKDGLQSNEFNSKAYHRSHDGLLFFGGINGITVIDENTFSLNEHIPKTYIQDAFLLTNQGLKRLKVSQQIIEKLDYHSNSLTFKIGAIDLQNQESIRYSYRLEGEHHNWIELGSQREITLLKISAGFYNLQVKSCNNEGTCNQSPVEVSFYIPPPPWLSWWAYVSYFLILLSVIIFYLKHHQNQLVYEKQQAQKEKQIANELQELHELKDQFLTNTSHELRTPLNGIIGLSEMIELDPDNGVSNDTIESIKAIKNCGNQLSTLVEDLLDFSQLQNKRLILKPEYFDINDLVKHIVLLLQPQARKRKLIIKAVYFEMTTKVYADINRIRQVIYNLVNNAIKFSNSGTINIILLKTNQFVKITVKDQGIGIDKDFQQKVFESFAQVDGSNSRVRGGIGLGLAISKDIIELHASELKITSELGIGTEFSFKLPIKEA